MNRSDPNVHHDPPSAESLNVEIYADGADLAGIAALAANPLIRGFTTNPTLLRKAGVTDYSAFAHDALSIVEGRPISFEVFADTPSEIEAQARILASWGENVFVKIPVTTTDGSSTAPLVRHLAAEGVRQNVTALMTLAQVEETADALDGGPDSFVSLFAGRVADTGRDPVPLMAAAVDHLSSTPHVRLIWASPREVLNIIQADEVGCHVITVTHDLLAKLGSLGKDLDEFSLDTVRMFHDDAAASGYHLAEN